jgi:23S rRNA pseudouridine2605 synthase
MVRLQKILSGAGVASRRAAEQLMREGRVSVNGRTVRDLGTKADPAQDDIRVDGRRITSRERPRYLLLNKPRGYITTRSDPQRRRTVLALLAGVREYIYPVGRLDFDSEGLLILTNDGDLAARLTHPRHQVPRVYEARVRGVPDSRTLDRIARGVVIDGRRTAPAAVRLVRELRDTRYDQAILELTLVEGRNRQVRKMCEAIGHPVLTLRRTRIGPISDPRLPPGAWRDLTPREVAALQRVAASTGPSPAPTRESGAAIEEAEHRRRPDAVRKPAHERKVR